MIKKTLHTLLAAGFLLPTLFSCAEKEQEIPVETGSYTYQFVVEDGDSRAFLNDDGVFWETGDQVGLYAGNAASAAADVNASASPKTITYTSGSPLPAGTTICSYYPYQEGNTDVSATAVSIPAAQQGGSLSAMPMAGIPFQIQQGAGNQGVIRFRNLGSIIDFRVFSSKYAGERVRAIRLTATAGSHPVSGEATVDLTGIVPGDDASMALSWPSGASNPSSVTLSQSVSVAATKEAAEDAGHLYMVIAPGTYSGTITVTTNVATYTFPFTDKQFNRNGGKRFNMNLDNAEREAWYVKVTSASDIVDGGKYLIVYENTPVAFKPILSGTNALEESTNNLQAVTINDGRIRSNDAVDACQVMLEKAQSGYYMKAVALGYYFYPTDSNTTAGQTANTPVSITVSNSAVVNITAGSNNYFKYSTYSNCFKHSTTNSSRELALYMLDESVQKPQTLQFSASSYIYITEGQVLPIENVAGPELTGYYTTVTYSSSNEGVATVDPASGVLTIRGEGTAVITATAEADDEYLAGSASYTLTVAQEAVYSIENDKMAEYLDLVDANPYNPPGDYSMTYMTTDIYSGNTSQTNRLDWPKPVPVTWTTPTSSQNSMTVQVYNDADYTEEELTANVTVTSTTSADVYSLIPGRKYYYVVKDGNTPIAEGSFRTMGRRRMIKVGDSGYSQNKANNCRDLGGMKTADNRVIKYGKIYRGSNMDGTNTAQRTYLRDYMGIGLDVDLRETSGANPLNVTVSDENYNSWDGKDLYGNSTGLSDASKMKVTISDIFKAINVTNTGVYIHCKVGADRTGYVCMLLEAVLGIEQGWCDVDYELTSFSGAVDRGQPRCRTGSPVNYYYRTKNGKTQGVDYIYSLSGGDYVNIYGDTFQAKAVNYVVNTLGIPFADVQAFQNNMLEPVQ